jgi:hypothetical protein
MPQNKPSKTAPRKPPPGSRAAAARPVGTGGPGKRPPARKPGKSIVNQKQTPWGLIITVVVLVLFAGGIVAFAVTRSSGSDSGVNARYVMPEISAAKKIPGVLYKKEPDHTHVAGTVDYNTSPPTGGDHSQYWANCTGTVYTHQIANENAVHMLEHGAVWITYNPKTATKAEIATLTSLVDGVDRTALSPYAGLKTPISLQAWDYQLFVQKASDPRITEFLDALRLNPKTTPELGVSCSDPSFVASKSTPGHPFEG